MLSELCGDDCPAPVSLLFAIEVVTDVLIALGVFGTLIGEDVPTVFSGCELDLVL